MGSQHFGADHLNDEESFTDVQRADVIDITRTPAADDTLKVSPERGPNKVTQSIGLLDEFEQSDPSLVGSMMSPPAKNCAVSQELLRPPRKRPSGLFPTDERVTPRSNPDIRRPPPKAFGNDVLPQPPPKKPKKLLKSTSGAGSSTDRFEEAPTLAFPGGVAEGEKQHTQNVPPSKFPVSILRGSSSDSLRSGGREGEPPRKVRFSLQGGPIPKKKKEIPIPNKEISKRAHDNCTDESDARESFEDFIGLQEEPIFYETSEDDHAVADYGGSYLEDGSYIPPSMEMKELYRKSKSSGSSGTLDAVPEDTCTDTITRPETFKAAPETFKAAPDTFKAGPETFKVAGPETTFKAGPPRKELIEEVAKWRAALRPEIAEKLGARPIGVPKASERSNLPASTGSTYREAVAKAAQHVHTKHGAGSRHDAVAGDSSSTRPFGNWKATHEYLDAVVQRPEHESSYRSADPRETPPVRAISSQDWRALVAQASMKVERSYPPTGGAERDSQESRYVTTERRHSKPSETEIWLPSSSGDASRPHSMATLRKDRRWGQP